MTELYQLWSREHWAALTGKLIAPEYLGNGTPAPFRQEERTLRALNHPNIVRLFGSGEAEGRPFLLLEYFSGPTLLELLEAMPRRRLTVPDAIRTAMHVGAAVHYLHTRGYVYRDLKPANILLREGIPVLVDFDAARRLRMPPARDRLGTPPYMAPEQVRREQLGAATDAYGLGAVLYELLSGHWPTEEPRDGDEDDEWDDEDFDDDKAPGGRSFTPAPPARLSARDLRRRYPQIAQPPVSLRRHVRSMPRDLEAVVMRSLAMDPAERFASMAEMLGALAPLLRGPHRLWPPAAHIDRRPAAEAR
jgi:serine/threonine protein kinase